MGGKSGSTGEGTAVLYPVLMRTDQEDADTKLEVKANNRYVINIKSVGSNVITATIDVQKWIEADTVKVESGYGIFGLSMPETDPKGEMTDNKLVLTDAAATTDIVVNVAADTEWKVETDCEWIDLTGVPEEGKVGKKLTFATKNANPRNDKTRVGRIVFINKMRPSITQTLLVEQPVNDSGTYLNVDMPKDITGLSIQGDTITLPGYAGEVNLPLDGTNAETVTVTSNNTAMATVAKSGGNDAVVVTMLENTTGADREGILTVTDVTASLEQKYRIVQKAKSLGMIVLSGGSIVDRVLSLDAAETEGKTINVKASSAWKFDGDEDPTDGYTKEWVTLSDVTGNTGEGSFKLTATENTSFDAREVEIKVVNTVKEGIYSILTVKQAGKPETIEVTGTDLKDNKLSVAFDAASDIELTVAADLKDGGTWELVGAGTTLDEWLTLGIVGEGANKFTVTPTANETDIARSVNITVQKKDDPTVKQVITVTQAGTTI